MLSNVASISSFAPWEYREVKKLIVFAAGPIKSHVQAAKVHSSRCPPTTPANSIRHPSKRHRTKSWPSRKTVLRLRVCSGPADLLQFASQRAEANQRKRPAASRLRRLTGTPTAAQSKQINPATRSIRLGPIVMLNPFCDVAITETRD